MEKPNWRFQDPVPPFPYHEQEVCFRSGELNIAGTITVPGDGSNYPAILLIAGSAAHTRNAELNGHKLSLVLADFFTRRGFATLRYDKRGNGNSSGNFSNATTLDLASDALAAVEFLHKQPLVDKTRISLVGHSEGGMIAALVAGHAPNISAIVMLGAPCVPGAQMVLTSTERRCRAAGMPETLLAPLLDCLHKLFSVATTGAPVDELIASIPDCSVAARAHVWSTPWGRHLLGYDPRPALSQVRCPILALYAEKDTQVITFESIAQAHAVLSGRTAVVIEEVPGVNHYFQTCTTGAREEYELLQETFSTAVMSRIDDFLQAR